MILESKEAERVDSITDRAITRTYGHVGSDNKEKITESRSKGDASKNKNKDNLPIFKPLHLDEDVSEKVVREAVEKINKFLSGSNRKFEISVHDVTNVIMIKVIDTDTNEMIKEIPPEKMVDLMVSICEMAGIMFDRKA